MKKASNRKRLFVLRDTSRRIGQSAEKNFEGGHNYRELKKMAEMFSSFAPMETRTRIGCLRALSSAKLVTKVLIPGVGEFIPETTFELQQGFLGNEQEQECFFTKKRIAVLDPLIVAYNSQPKNPSISQDPKSRWNRDWEAHVRSIRSLEIRKEDSGKCTLFINL